MTAVLGTPQQTGHRREFGLAELLHPVDPGEFERDHRDQRELLVRRDDPGFLKDLLGLAGGPPEPSGHLLDLEALASLDLGTPVRRRGGLICGLTIDQGLARVEFGGKSVQMPERVMAELRFVAEPPELTGRQLPGTLDEPGRLLLPTLLREGFLTTVGRGGTAGGLR